MTKYFDSVVVKSLNLSFDYQSYLFLPQSSGDCVAYDHKNPRPVRYFLCTDSKFNRYSGGVVFKKWVAEELLRGRPLLVVDVEAVFEEFFELSVLVDQVNYLYFAEIIMVLIF